MGKNVNLLIDKRGDSGKTSLLPDKIRISKSSLRVEALGDLDELQAALGLARINCSNPSIKKALRDIQKNIFILGSELATPPHLTKKLSERIDQNSLLLLERVAISLQNKTKIGPGFTLSGKNKSAAYINFARAVCRRLERKCVRLFELKQLKNRCLLAWINRLSVYLYIMSRFVDKSPDFLKT